MGLAEALQLASRQRGVKLYCLILMRTCFIKILGDFKKQDYSDRTSSRYHYKVIFIDKKGNAQVKANRINVVKIIELLYRLLHIQS